MFVMNFFFLLLKGPNWVSENLSLIQGQIAWLMTRLRNQRNTWTAKKKMPTLDQKFRKKLLTNWMDKAPAYRAGDSGFESRYGLIFSFFFFWWCNIKCKTKKMHSAGCGLSPLALKSSALITWLHGAIGTRRSLLKELALIFQALIRECL